MDVLGAARWGLLDSEGTRWADLGDDVMVFNPLSWESHRVSPLVMFVLEALRKGNASQAEIIQSLPPSDLSDAALDDAVSQTLQELVRLGLAREVRGS